MSASPIQASLNPKQVSEFSQNYQTFKTNHQKFTTVIQAPGKMTEGQFLSAADNLQRSYRAFKSNGRRLLAVLEQDSDHYSKITKVLANCKLILKECKAQASPLEPKGVETSKTKSLVDEQAKKIRRFFTSCIQEAKQTKKNAEKEIAETLQKIESAHAKNLKKCTNKRDRAACQKSFNQMKETAQLKYNESIQKLDNVIEAVTRTYSELEKEFASFKAGNLNEDEIRETAKTLGESLQTVLKQNSFKPTQVV